MIFSAIILTRTKIIAYMGIKIHRRSAAILSLLVSVVQVIAEFLKNEQVKYEKFEYKKLL